MPALDTNVLVRYVVQDDSGLPAAAKRLITRCVREGQLLFVPVTVMLELAWVLRASFGYDKDDVLQVLSSLPSTGGRPRSSACNCFGVGRPVAGGCGGPPRGTGPRIMTSSA